MKRVSRDIAESTSRLMTSRQLAECLKVSSRTLERWRAAGIGPEFLSLGKLVRYQAEHVNKWLKERSTYRDDPSGPLGKSTAGTYRSAGG
jgi:predicted DNA-binding transcriptional regulator AlpA